jgi:hypothetical protein
MEPAENERTALIELIIEAIKECTDADLLDLLYKLLMA